MGATSPSTLASRSVHTTIPEYVASLVSEYLQDDKQSLVLCARVCRAFMDPCQRLIYRMIQLRDPPRGSGKPVGAFIMFIKLLLQSSRLSSYIEELGIEGNFNISPRPLLDPLLLASMLSLLPNLRHLEISCVRLRPHPTDLRVIPNVSATARFNLEQLTLIHNGSEEEETGDLYSLLNLFGTIDTLILHTNLLPTDGFRQKSVFPSNLRVRHLVVNSLPEAIPGADFYYRFIARTQVRKTLKIIVADCCSRNDILALGNLLDRCGRNLVQVMIRLAHKVELEDGEAQKLMLHKCTRLKTLRILLPATLIDSFFRAFLTLSPALERITIRYVLPRGGSSLTFVQQSTWDLLDNIRDTHVNLERITFTEIADLEQLLLRHTLPKLHLNDVLRFQSPCKSSQHQLVTDISDVD